MSRGPGPGGFGLGARTALVVFAVALAVRAANLWWMADDPSLFRVEDSAVYEGGAEALVKHAAFVIESDDGPRPQTERMPLYILMLALPRALGIDSILAPLGLQVALDALTCVLIGMLGSLVSQPVARLSGLLAALWPNLIVHSAQVLTDSLFLCLLSGAMVAFAYFVMRPSSARAALLGACVGLALLTRSAAQFAPPVIVITMAVAAGLHLRARRRPGALLLAGGHAFVFAAVVGALIGPVLVRNVQTFETLALTSQGGTHLLNWVTPRVVLRATGTATDISIAKLDTEAERRIAARIAAGQPSHAFARSQVRTALALETLAEAPAAALAAAWGAGAVRTLATPAILHDQRIRRRSNASFAATEGGLWTRVTGYLGGNTRSYVIWAVAGLSGAALACGLQLLGAVLVLRQVPLAGLAGIAVIAYFLLLNGPVGDAKYRLPLEPVLLVFMATALHGIRRWHAPRPGPPVAS